MEAAAVMPTHRVRTKVETITPEIAKAWLEKNEANRNVIQGTVDRYARDMKEGRWLLTGEPIVFGASGRLLNGQHRLWACMLAEVEFESLVVRGVASESEVMDVMDTGVKRTLAHALQIHGEKDSHLLAAIVNNCVMYERDRMTHPTTPTHSEGLAWLEQNPEVRQAVWFARQSYQARHLHPSSAGAAYFLNARIDAEAAEEFWTGVISGEGLRQGDVRLAYIRWITGTISKREKTHAKVWLMYALKAMNVYRDGRTIRILQVKPAEGMPGLWEPA